MPPKKSGLSRKTSDAKRKQISNKSLSLEDLEKLRNSNKESVQRHRRNQDEEKYEKILAQDLQYQQNRR